MYKLIFIILFILLFAFPAKVHGAETHAESAKLISNIEVKSEKSFKNDVRVKALKNVFAKYNSPLASEAEHYIKYADLYGVDWKLLPAISGLESSFGLRLMPGSHNAYGWGGGHIYFESWEDGIRTINKALAEKYMSRGAADVWSIGPIYAESPTWAVRVNRFMNEINEEYLRLSMFTVAPTI